MLINTAANSVILARHFGPAVILVIVITAVAYLATIGLSQSKRAALRAEYVDRVDSTSSIKPESVGNVELLKYFGMESYEVNRYGKALLHVQKADWEGDLFLYAAQLVQDNVKVIGRARTNAPA